MSGGLLVAAPQALAGSLTGGLQRGLGELLRARVAGDDAQSRAEVIWGTPGERWFTPAHPVWRVHAHATMFPGGLTSLLLQSLHPLAMAGVAGHSGYRGDPWGRLQRTSYYIAATTFGTIEHAEEVIAHVRSIHLRVKGKDHRGRPYAASDPHLLRWVHIAEIWSFLSSYQRYSGSPLTPAEADRYVDQTRVAAELLGATDLPTTVAELAAAIQSYRPELEASPAALDAARFLLREPPLPWLAKPGYALVARGGIACLPPWARHELGLWEIVHAGPVDVALGRVAVRTIGWAMAGVRAQEPALATLQA